MNVKLKEIIKNSGYVFFSNFLALVISSLVILVLPKIIGVVEYGYWQLYTFYVGYVGVFHFGWIDGIYLRYGGEHYHELNKDIFSGQFVAFSLFQVFVALIGLWFILGNIQDENKRVMFIVLSVALISTNLRQFFIYVLQTTNRLKVSSVIQVMDRVLFVFLLVGLVLGSHLNSHIPIMFVDLTARVASLFIAIYCCRDIVFQGRAINGGFSFRETVENIHVGMNLMFANLAGLLIIGVIRFSIEQKWDVATFGKVSLALSVSNFVMIFINALGVVFFPLLKRMDEQERPVVFCKIRKFLVPLLFFSLLLVYPMKAILDVWLPEYQESFFYMSLLFPILIYEGKMGLLNNVYMKALRQEHAMLRINLFIVVCSVLLALLNYGLLESLLVFVFSIVFVLWLRCILFELLLARRLHLSQMYRSIFLETMFSLSFMIINYYYLS